MGTFEAICIGDELLEGRICDANTAALGAFLSERGHELSSARFVGDGIDEILGALEATQADVVVVSGGLGPTSDDLTRDAAAKFFDSVLVLHQASLDHIKARFEARGREFTENNRRQAMIPRGAAPLATEVGTAPAFVIERDERKFFFFPGVPREFRWFVARNLTPLVESRSDRSRRHLQFYGLGESALETRIADIVEEATARGLVVGYRAAFPVIELKLAGEPDLVAETGERVIQRLRQWWIGEDDESLSARVGRLLLERGETVATAESCTAGGIAAMLTEVSGSSAWFGRGYVTYANEAKAEELGVLESTLLAHGAVSAQTVCQMASGARKRARSTYALAVSGIAGPGGGSPDKPVGTVHFGLATPRGTHHRHVLFAGSDRAGVRSATAYTALAMLLALLEDRGAELGEPSSDDDVWQPTGVPQPEAD